ncbi:hypothetical protein HYPSUDRAFT_206585 [Hypholoma sublateritium FD-334 SS-4]|uniref:Uncharacterized protein n=1 Tax=Hypholoma sublateritium (strain FD-334 SS-4) TaxID=945553 RepID=A0A0D2ND65_HYPSF|nr:hypothetical protein HYPSUDRAFT_206585 [Hypholoma sublateritium FD-334 SS-4]
MAEGTFEEERDRAAVDQGRYGQEIQPADPAKHIAQFFFGVLCDENWNRIEELVTFSRYAHRYLRSHAPNVMSLELRHISCIMLNVNVPVDVPLVMSIPLSHEGSTRVPSTVLNKVALREFSCVTVLNFCSTSPINPSLAPFLICFTSLKTINADSQTLGYLTALQSNINATDVQMVIFPLLEVIDFDRDFDENDIFKVDSVTAGFISLRMRVGHPITTLRLPEWTWIVTLDLEALAEAKGLKVVYPRWVGDDMEGTVEYICSGVDRENSSDSV